MKEIEIRTDIIKLDQLIKWIGLVQSGSEAKELILSGKVMVNGEVITQRGKKIYRGYKITIDNYGDFNIV